MKFPEDPSNPGVKPARKPAGGASPDEAKHHAHLGNIVRRGLDRTYEPSFETQWAERAYRQVLARSGAKAWPLFLGGFGAVCAAAAMLLAWFGGGAKRPVAFARESGLALGRPPVAVGQPGAADVIHFSDGSVVTFRKGGNGQILATSGRGAAIELEAGQAHFQLAPQPDAAWAIRVGRYEVESGGAEIEATLSPSREMLSLGVYAGRVAVKGPGAPSGRTLHAGESVIARARDGIVKVGTAQVLLAGLSREESAEGMAEALVAAREVHEATGGEVDNKGESLHQTTNAGPAPDASGVCPSAESTLPAVADPGPVSLATCGHIDPGPTGKDVQARMVGESWVRSTPGACLHYMEDSRGNRVPDFSYAGYHGGGVMLPAPATLPATVTLQPGATGDDTMAIQEAIDSVAALGADPRGIRGVVELASGVFTLKGSLKLNKSGVVLRGQGPDGPNATILKGVGAPRTLIRMGASGKRQPGREALPVSDIYVPVGARSIGLERTAGLQVGDDIIVYRPKTQRWICAIGTDVMPPSIDGIPNPPWRPTGSFSFERRITKIEGNRIFIDAPLTNALEKEYTPAFITAMEFPERVGEIGVENLAARGEFIVLGKCANPRGKLVRADAVVNAWVRNVRAENMGGEVASLGSGSKWMTVEDATYASGEAEHCAGLTAFTLGGQQNLVLRGRSLGAGVTAIMTETEIEGPNAVVDFTALGRGAKVRVAPRWSTGMLFDNVRLQDGNGQLTGEIDLGRGGSTFGWSAANSVVWNSEAETLNVDSPPTAHNWIMGSNGRTFVGTGAYSGMRAALTPQSLYRAQLVERLGRSALGSVGPTPGRFAATAALAPTATTSTGQQGNVEGADQTAIERAGKPGN